MFDNQHEKFSWPFLMEVVCHHGRGDGERLDWTGLDLPSIRAVLSADVWEATMSSQRIILDSWAFGRPVTRAAAR